MRFLIVGPGYQQKSHRIREEAEKRGHFVDIVEPTGLYAVFDSQIPTWDIGSCGYDFSQYDLCLFYHALQDRALHGIGKLMHERYGTVIIHERFLHDDFASASVFGEMRRLITEDIRFPKTAVISQLIDLDALADAFTLPVVVKKLTSSAKQGVTLAHDWDEVETFIREHFHQFRPFFLIREYIQTQREIRVFTIGHRAVAAMQRDAKDQIFMGSFLDGHALRPLSLTKHARIQDLAERISRLFGYELAGIDLLIHQKTGDPYFLEINNGARFQLLERVTGENIAGRIVDYFEERVRKADYS